MARETETDVAKNFQEFIGWLRTEGSLGSDLIVNSKYPDVTGGMASAGVG
ncbi:hypothetical protein [Arthrobacter sp. MMS24-S77]